MFQKKKMGLNVISLQCQGVKNISIEHAFRLGSADQITTTTVMMKEVGVFFIAFFKSQMISPLNEQQKKVRIFEVYYLSVSSLC